MKGVALENCEVGTVSSMKDGSVKFTVYTAELRPSERGLVMDFHGKACAVTILPTETQEELVRVTTERDTKTPSMRLRNVLLVHWRQEGQQGDFESFYSQKMNLIIEGYKQKNLDP